jgi:hypothetical protein
MRGLLISFVLCGTLCLNALAQAPQPAADESATALCSFEDGKQITARYTPVTVGHADTLPSKIFTPGGTAIALFTETDVMLNNTVIPTGGYTMYLLGGKKEWTLIVSRNADLNAKYEESKDLSRAPMEIGQLNSPEEKLSIYFGHTGPKRCEINVNYGKWRGWVEFREK